MNALLSILVAGLGTYFSRSVFIIALANRRIPRNLSLAMEYVGPSVLAALVASLLSTPSASGGPGAPELLALAVAILLAWKTRRHLLTLAGAMATFWIAGWLLGM